MMPGLQRDDVLLEIDHEQMRSTAEFNQLAQQDRRQHKAALRLVGRGDNTMFTVINPKG